MLGLSSIFLIGPMGSGKTAVGKHVARLLKLQFVDSDAEIVRRTGVDIPLIFEKEGEAGFRQRERDVIDALTQLPNVVLSTGGGAVLLPDNRHWLKTRGAVFYLDTSIAQQAARVKSGHHHRPLLAGSDDPAARLAELMVERRPLYLDAADFSVRTDGRRVQAVAEEIVGRVRRAPPPS